MHSPGSVALIDSSSSGLGTPTRGECEKVTISSGLIGAVAHDLSPSLRFTGRSTSLETEAESLHRPFETALNQQSSVVQVNVSNGAKTRRPD